MMWPEVTAPIHDAVRAGDVEAVRRELAAGVSPDLGATLAWGDDVTPLMVAINTEAATKEQLEITLLLLEAGADVDSMRRGDWSPLMVACMKGNEAIIAALIAAGASVLPRVCQHYGTVFLLERVYRNHRRVIPMLLRAGSPLPPSGHRPNFMGREYCCFNAAATNYVNAVAAAGGYVPYERAHRKRLAAIFTSKFPQLPEDVVLTVVEFWAHVGHYCAGGRCPARDIATAADEYFPAMNAFLRSLVGA